MTVGNSMNSAALQQPANADCALGGDSSAVKAFAGITLRSFRTRQHRDLVLRKDRRS
jgi:hypothetical protein